MKNFFIILIFPFLLACSKGISTNQTNGNPAQTEINFPSKAYLVSTYDDPQFADVLQNQREILEKLSIGKEFEIISLHLIKSLPEKHQKYFKTKSMYELLCVADGNLFENNKKDYAFSVYDKKNLRISIITYNEKKDQYSELYRDIKVENGLNE